MSKIYCKKCAKEIKPGSETIQFIKKKWKDAGKFAGSAEYMEEITVDAGVFCSTICLNEYTFNGTPG